MAASQRRVRHRTGERTRAARSSSQPENLNPENTMSQKAHASDDTHHELKTLLHEAEQALGNTVGEAGEKFDELRERLRAALDQGRYSFDHLKEETLKRAKQADGLVRENPYYAIGIAAGVGALIGIIASRSCNSR